MHGVVAGVRDYGNRMGIPTVNGAVCFDERYLGQPARLLRHGRPDPGRTRRSRQAQPGDLIVAVGGRTGRDGIHGATFSSLELTDESETVSGGAVQIGNAITEKKVLDVVLQARDRGLYTRDHRLRRRRLQLGRRRDGRRARGRRAPRQGAAEVRGAVLHRDLDPESQERMVLAVPPAKLAGARAPCARARTSRRRCSARSRRRAGCRLSYQGEPVARPRHALPARRPARR